MESFEYLTSSDYLDTFSFVSSNTEEQDQFMQVIDDVNSASETSGTSLMGLMISNAGNSIQSLKSAIDAAQAKNHMSAEEEISRFQSTLNSSFHSSALDEDGGPMSQQLEFDDDTTHSSSTTSLSSSHHEFYNDVEEIVEDRMNKLMKMMNKNNNNDDDDEPSMGTTDQGEQSGKQNREGGGRRQKEGNGDGSSDGQRDNSRDSSKDEENVDEHSRSGDDSGDDEEKKNNDDDNNDNEPEAELDEEYMNDRAWKVQDNMKDEGDKTVGDKVSVEIKTRSDRPQQVIPDRLYSSLKYEFHQKVSLDLRMSETSVMMCKMEIVDPKNPEEELLKANGERLIRGVQDFMAITINKSNTFLEVKSKFQFTGVSYHHDKKFFAMKLSYYDPSFDMSAPVFSMISAPFQVFARRPTARPSTGISRSSSSSSIADSIGDEELSTVSDKRRKKTNRNNNDSNSRSRRTTRKRKTSPLTIAIPELGDEDKASRLLKKAKRQKTNASGEPDLRNIEQQEINSAIDATQDAAFTNFFNCLELLIGFKQNLRPEEQKLALEIAHAKLFPEEQSNNDQHSPLPQDLLSEHSHQESSMFFSS